MSFFTEQVHHHGGDEKFCRAKRQVHDGPYVLLELACYTRFYGVMAGVVRAWCDLVDEDLTLFCEEHLDAKDSNTFKDFHDTHSDISCDLCLFLFYSGGCYHHIAYVRIFIEVHLHHRIARNLSLFVSCHHDSEFLFYLNEFLEVGLTTQGVFEIFFVFYDEHTSAVVSSFSRLLNNRKTKVPNVVF